MPAVFLRLQSAREQVALPYSSLIKLELKNDATAVELSYVTHRVMIAGRNLAEIYQAVAEAQASGKPAQIAEKMAEGKMRKYFEEVTLLGQPYVRDDKMQVGQIVPKGIKLVKFIRLRLGQD